MHAAASSRTGLAKAIFVCRGCPNRTWLSCASNLLSFFPIKIFSALASFDDCGALVCAIQRFVPFDLHGPRVARATSATLFCGRTRLRVVNLDVRNRNEIAPHD